MITWIAIWHKTFVCIYVCFYGPAEAFGIVYSGGSWDANIFHALYAMHSPSNTCVCLVLFPFLWRHYTDIQRFRILLLIIAVFPLHF